MIARTLLPRPAPWEAATGGADAYQGALESPSTVIIWSLPREST